LLHEDVLARAEQVLRDAALKHVRPGDADRFDLLVSGQFSVITVDFGNAQTRRDAPAQILAHFGNSQQLAFRQRSEIRQVNALRDKAATDVTETDGFDSHSTDPAQAEKPTRNLKIRNPKHEI